MLFSIIKSLDKVLVAFLCLQAVEAAPTSPNKSDLVKRAGYNLSPCVTAGSGHDYNAQPIAQAKGFNWKDAPWLPNCLDIKDRTQQAKCYACMSVAGGACLPAILSCTPESFACTVGVWECETVCIAVATYALWVAEQACYCEHADCGNALVRQGGNTGGPPTVTTAGRKFNLHLSNGWGYVGNRAIYVNAVGKGVATSC